MKVEVIAIRNERDYRAAKALMESLMDAESPEDVERLRTQALLVAAWEAKVSPPVPPTPIEAIRFRMEQMGLDTSYLAGILGGPSRVSEVLHGKRRLSLAMIRRLNRELKIPAEILIGG